MDKNLIIYDTPDWVTAFSTGKGSGVEDVGLRLEELALPRQAHSDHVRWVTEAGRPEDTDAVVTDRPGLCVCVKTADCIPILLYDTKQRVIAAVHAGWRGTVSRIVQKTVLEMQPHCPTDLHAIIGPGISLSRFEVGDEVYEAFLSAGFPVGRIARRMERWHIDLWDANRWLLEEAGLTDIYVQGTCTRTSENFYSARRETINTGRNYNGIFINS